MHIPVLCLLRLAVDTICYYMDVTVGCYNIERFLLDRCTWSVYRDEDTVHR